MGNSSTKIEEFTKFEDLFDLNYFNQICSSSYSIAKLKIGLTTSIPLKLKKINQNDYKSLINLVNVFIPELENKFINKMLCVNVKEIFKVYMCFFIIPEYAKERADTLLDFEKGNKLLVHNDQESILEYESKVYNRIRNDILPNINIFKQKIYKIINDKLLNGTLHTLNLEIKLLVKTTRKGCNDIEMLTLIKLINLFPFLKVALLTELNQYDYDWVEFNNITIQNEDYQHKYILVNFNEIVDPIIPSAPSAHLL